MGRGDRSTGDGLRWSIYGGFIVGWQTSTSLRTDLALDAPFLTKMSEVTHTTYAASWAAWDGPGAAPPSYGRVALPIKWLVDDDIRDRTR